MNLLGVTMKNLLINTYIAWILTTSASLCFALEGAIPTGIPELNHVFVIVLENHSYSDIRSNASAPFINSMADTGNIATNYFAVSHPSLPNYLEIVGGSDFNVLSDDSPDWHNTGCTSFTDTGTVCPLYGTGTENSTATSGISGKNITQQLEAKKLSWKNYQQSLPLTGADGVNYSDGFYSNLTDFSNIMPDVTPPLTNDDMLGYIARRYAVKHNPFAYFRHGQNADSLPHTKGFEGNYGLYADLRSGNVASFSFIVPDQCNDQHGTSGESFCSYAPALVERGDQTVKRIVTAIKKSSVWNSGKNAIILVWDEDDYSESNQVLAIVNTNYIPKPYASNKYYNHFSLLKTLESAFGLPCLNHACDNDVKVMRDMFNSP